MKFFNKLSVFLIIASFISSGDVFARNPDDVNNERRSIRKTLARAKRAQIRKERPARTTRAAKRKARPAITDRKRTVRSKRGVVRSQRRAQARTPDRKQTVRTPRAHTQRTEPNPVRNTRKSRAAAPSYYTVSPNDIPEDLKNDLRLLGARPEEFRGRTTPEDFRNALAHFQNDENMTRGMTQKFRNLYVSQGYNPESAGNFEINTATLTEEQKNLLRLGLKTPHLNPTYTAAHAQVTIDLNTVQNLENRSVGLTQRVRDFFREKYGFQG